MNNSSVSDLSTTSQLKPQSSHRYFQFNRLFLLSILGIVGLVGLINFLVDPYDIYQTPKVVGINNSKPEKNNNDRLYKAVDIIRIKPKTVILGSSRTKQGIDPEHPILLEIQPSYNLAINGANMYELRRYLEHALKNQSQIQKVILGLDFFMFNQFLENQPTFSETRLEKKYIDIPDLINSLFSLSTLEISQETISASFSSHDRDTSYGENGFAPHRTSEDGQTQGRFKGSINQFFEIHHQYKLSENYLADFKKIVDICRKNQIDLVVFISPSHATQWEAIEAIGAWESFENWKKDLVKITPVWDFSDYNSITSEPIKDVMENYADNSHYTKKVGDLVLNRIFSYQVEQVPSDFGVLMTPDNIEKHLETIRQNRQQWLKKQPKDEQLVKEIKRNFDQKQKSNS